jgi:hypothetical protein
MGRWVLGAVFAAWIFPGPASGQAILGVARVPGITIHRQDPLPQPPPAQRPDPPAPTDGDLFRAGPDTYAPYDPSRPSRFPLPYGAGYFFPTSYDPPAPVIVVVPQAPIIRIVEREVPPREKTVEPPVQMPAPVIAAPAVTPAAIYIIPRCYVGDRVPIASRLPAGCDLADLRVIPGA